MESSSDRDQLVTTKSERPRRVYTQGFSFSLLTKIARKREISKEISIKESRPATEMTSSTVDSTSQRIGSGIARLYISDSRIRYK